MIVRMDGSTVRIYSRNAYDWTARLRVIAAAAERIKAGSFTIDGEAVVLGPDGLSRFEELRSREATHTAELFAFDLVEHDGEDHYGIAHSSTARPGWRDCCAILRDILLNEHIAEDGPTVFARACRLGAEGIVSKKVDGTYRSGPCPVWIKVRNPASVAVEQEHTENWNR